MVRSLSLNSSDDYSLEVHLHGIIVTGTQQSTLLLDKVRFYNAVKIDLKSSSPISKVTGYGTTQEFSVPSDEIFFSPGKCRETMTRMLDLMNIPFSLDGKQIKWKDFYSMGKADECKSLESSEDLIRELVEFFHSFAENKVYLKNRLLYVVIRKIQTIGEDEFEEWKSFRETNPGKYFEFVHCRPELQMLFRLEALKVLERVRVEKSGGDLAAADCSICLEELLKTGEEVAQVIRLPCSHAYHEACILRWLGKKQSCPYCRANSPRIQIDYRSRLSNAYGLQNLLSRSRPTPPPI